MTQMSKGRGVRVCLAAAVTVVAGLAATGCADAEVGRTMEATVAVDLPDSIPVGSPFDVGYSWTPGDDFVPPADDYRVFVHFVDPDGNIVVQDDHFPTVPTSQWRAGEAVEYRHWVYPDPELAPEYFDLYVGLYDDVGQIGTRRDDRFQDRPLVHTVQVESDNQSGKPVFVEGFEEYENSLTSDDPANRRWRWMRSRGVVAFGNPRGPAMLHVRALSPVDDLGGPQTITIKMGEQLVARYEVDHASPHTMLFDVPGQGLGDGDWVDFTFEVNDTFVPAETSEGSEDTRDLGLQVYWMYLAPNRGS